MPTAIARLTTVAGLWLSLVLVTNSPCGATNGHIGAFLDPAATLCSGTVPTPGGASMWLTLVPKGATCGGITAYEFGIEVETTDPGWQVNFDPEGYLTAFAVCQTGEPIPITRANGDPVTVSAFHLGANGGELTIRVVAHPTPTNVLFQCPLVTLCDAPAFTKVCLGDNVQPCGGGFPAGAVCSTSGETIINPQGAAPECPTGCTVSVEESSWGQIKAIYAR